MLHVTLTPPRHGLAKHKKYCANISPPVTKRAKHTAIHNRIALALRKSVAY